MTILLKATFDSIDYYLTEQGGGVYATTEASEQYWVPKISSIGKIQWRLSKINGGRVKINLGSFILFPDATIFPAPRIMDVICWKQLDSGNMFLFAGTAVLGDFKPLGLNYRMYEKELDVDLLDDAPDLGSTTDRVYPLAIGAVNLVKPLQVGGTTDYQYWKAGITETVPGSGIYNIYDNNSVKILTIDDQATEFQSITKEVWLNGTSIESSFSDGDTATVLGTGTPTDYIGTYIVTSTRTNGIKIRLRTSQGYGDYTSGNTVGGVSVTSVDLIPGKPVADILFSGTGADSTLIDFFDFAKDRINTALSTSYTLTTTNASAVTISGYETQQKNIFDFLSELSAACNHLYYIDDENDVIHLVDMQKNNGTLAPDEFSFFSNQPRYQNPIKNVVHKWVSKVIELDDQGYPKLITAQEEQSIILDSPVGKADVPIKVYDRVKANIETLLDACGVSYQAPISNIDLPFQTGIAPGLSITYPDSRFPTTQSTTMRARTIEFDPDVERIKVEGHVSTSGLLTVPGTPAVGQYSQNIENDALNDIATQQRESFVTVATNEFDGQYGSFFEGFEAIEDTGGTVLMKEGVYYWDLPSEKIEPKAFSYNFIGVGKGLVTLKIKYDGTIKAFDDSSPSICTGLKFENIDIEWETTSSNEQFIIFMDGDGSTPNLGKVEIRDCTMGFTDGTTKTVAEIAEYDLRIDGCVFDASDTCIDSRDDVSIPATTVKTITNTIFKNNEVFLLAIRGKSVSVLSCSFLNYTGEALNVVQPSSGAGVLGWKTYINNNTFERSGSFGGDMVDIRVFSPVLEIIDNKFKYDITISTDNDLTCIDVSIPADSTTGGSINIKGNVIDVDYTINLSNTISGVRGIEITNVTSGTGFVIPTEASGNKVKMVFSSTSSVSGTGYGVRAIGSDRLQVLNNSLDISGANLSTARYGIYLQNDYNIATGNRIINFTTAIRSVGGNDVITPNILA